MTKANTLSFILLIGYIPLNIGIVFGIVAIDNWFLVSLVYLVLFGIVAPIVVLIPFWIFVSKTAKGRNSFILAVLATLATLLGGGVHFFIFAIASASV